MKTEKRFIKQNIAKIETRADDDEKRFISGYGSVFYDGSPETEYQLWSNAFERIDPSAFDNAIKDDDVRGLFNHDANMLLGRNIAGTMALSVDKTGLKYDIEVPDTTVGRDTVTSIDRGDLTGSSFSFRPTKVEWSEEERDGVMFEIRTIKDVRLYDVGPVTFPAYEGATTSARSLDDIKSERDEQIKKEDPKPSKKDLDILNIDLKLRNINK